MKIPHQEDGADLPDFTPERVHLLFQGVYGDFLHNNGGSHLDLGVLDNAVKKRHWRRHAA